VIQNNHTETMMKKVMELVDTMVMNEVQKKTCATLSPNMREYLGWMLEMDREEEPSEQVYSVISRCVLRTYTRNIHTQSSILINTRPSLTQTLPLPLVQPEPVVLPQGERPEVRFLFDANIPEDKKVNISDLGRRIKVLEDLVMKYNALTALEKTKVQKVHDYLVRPFLNQTD